MKEELERLLRETEDISYVAPQVSHLLKIRSGALLAFPGGLMIPADSDIEHEPPIAHDVIL